MSKIHFKNILKFYYLLYLLFFWLISFLCFIIVILNYPKGGEASIGATYYSLIPGLPVSYFIEFLLQDNLRFEFLGTTSGRIMLSMLYIFIGYIFWLKFLPLLILKLSKKIASRSS